MRRSTKLSKIGQADPFIDADSGSLVQAPGSANPSDPGALQIDLPGTRLAAWMLMTRRLRDEVIPSALCPDPAWNILLDLYTAGTRGGQVQISSLSPMTGLPWATAGRWARALVAQGYLQGVETPLDRRCNYIRLSSTGIALMQSYFVALAAKGVPPGVLSDSRPGRDGNRQAEPDGA